MSDDIGFYGSCVFLVTDKSRRAATARRRLDHNPFLEPSPGLLIETDEERTRWRADARKYLRACYREAEQRLGEDEARTLFTGAVTRRKRGQQKGKTRGRLLPDLRAVLLEAYDNFAATIRDKKRSGTIPRELARQFSAEGPQYGQSTPAIERHIRRLLKERERRPTESAEQHLRLRKALKRRFGEELPRSLLSTLADNE
jgi:hypothetical protein